MDVSWLEPLKGYLSYQVPIGVFLIFLLSSVMLYLISTAHIRKTTKISMESLQGGNKDLRDHIDQLMTDNTNLRNNINQLMTDNTNLRNKINH
ncbi:cell division protein FtsB [Streptococcus porcorum]|uniref:Cell division protein FtsB n=2 Tax=Streptococcus porcorum TaxID=701526 RepID=A0ABV2JG38_9STRE